jgi:hypothetical protein
MRGQLILYSVLSCVVTASTAFATGGAAANSQEVLAENERAREKFRLGVNAFRAERFEEARQLLSEAWRLRRTYDVAASLAQVEHELGHHGRAAELLDFCLNNFAPIESDTKFQELRQVFDEVQKRVGQIDLTRVPPGAEVWVDEELVGTTPLGLNMYLEPGLHEFDIRLGKKSLRRSLVVQAGAQHRVPIELSHDNAEPAPGSARPSSGAGERAAAAPGSLTGTRPTFPYYIGGALLVAGSTIGVTFHLASNHARIRADDLRTRSGVSDCSVTGATSTEFCRSLQDADAERVFNRNFAVFGYGVAGTAALTMAIYWLWPESDRATKSEYRRRTTWSAAFEPSRVWITAAGSFP